uniref:Small nuclear ribonucleoprotein Prp3 C-terminal domain-containing protein n=1 Tax=Heterosigma akashiwo TaxID=2829 RepID=A0A7S3Y146_HETAK
MPVQFFFFSRETFGALVMLMPDISFQIQMLDDLSLLVKLPRRYPEVALKCSIKTAMPIQELRAKVDHDIQQIFSENRGEEHLLQVLQYFQDDVRARFSELQNSREVRRMQHHNIAQQNSAELHGSFQPKTSTKRRLGRRLIWSHHIIGKEKRRDMKAIAKELELGGYCKIGWPGIIILEGEEEGCEEFIRQIRRWQWQHLVVRGEETVDLPFTVPSQPELAEGGPVGLDSFRALPTKEFVELPETEVSTLATICRDAGLEELFRTALK